MVPRLAFNGRGPRDLLELLGRGADERELAIFRDDQQQILIGQQHELAVAVAPALPFAFAVREIDARHDAAVEAEDVALVDHEIAEVRLEPGRRPALVDAPSAGSAIDGEPPQAQPAGRGDGVHEHVAFVGHGGLHDLPRRPLVLPQHLPVRRRHADGPGAAEQQNLDDAVDGREVRRAVASSV
jgi:hypothetical protein